MIQENTEILARPIKSKKKTTPSLATSFQKIEKKNTQIDNHHSLNPRNIKFIRFYVEGNSARKAAILAGYSESVANNASVTLLRNPLIIAEINKRTVEYEKQFDTDKERIKAGYWKIVNANIYDYGDVDDNGKFLVNLRGVNREQASVIKSVYFDANNNPLIELYDRKAALDALAKINGLGIGKVEFPNGKNTADQAITIDYLDGLVQQNIVVNQTTINVNDNKIPRKQIESNVIDAQ